MEENISLTLKFMFNFRV